MLTVSELAKSWGVSHQYVSKLVKHGLPLKSFEGAAAWREAHARSKASTNPRQIAKQLTEEKNDASPTINPRRKRHFKGGTRSFFDDQLADALDSTIRAQEEAWRLLQEAMIEGKDSKISVRLSIHNKAVEGRLKAGQLHREELERRSILIPLATAQDMAKRGFDLILARLRCLPQNVAPRCNPANAHQAMEVLEAECNGILADAQRVFVADAV